MRKNFLNFISNDNILGLSVTPLIDVDAPTLNFTLGGKTLLDSSAAKPPLVNRQDIIGTIGDDTLDGTSSGERIEGLGGDDTINGLGGDDTLYGREAFGTQDGDDTLNGGDGNDRIIGGAGNDILYGGGLYDFDATNNGELFEGGTFGDDYIDGGAGQDRIRDVVNIQIGENVLRWI